MQQGAILPRLILDLVLTTECLSILRFGHLCPTSRLSSLYLHIGRLCSSRLCSDDHGPPAAVPSTPSFIPSLPTISAKSAPGAKTTPDAPLQVLQETSYAPLQVITATDTSAGTTPRSLSAQHDSTAPDSALPNALSSSRVRSSGTGEGDYGEQTQDNLLFDDGHPSFPVVLRPDPVQSFPLECFVQSTRSMSNQSDHVIRPDETYLYPHRLSRHCYGPTPVVSATPPPLSPFPPNLSRSAPGAVKPAPLPVHTAPHTTAGFPTRFRLLLRIRRVPMNLSTPLLQME
jgi:hypothetical protein